MLICTDTTSAPRDEKPSYLLSQQEATDKGNIYWPNHSYDTINSKMVPATMHVIDPTTLVWSLFYKLRAKHPDWTDALQ